MYSCLFSKLFAFIAVLLVGPCSAVRFENDPAALETASATGISYANSLVRRSLGVLNETISSVIESHSMNLPSTTMSLTRCKESLQNVHVYLNATEKNIYSTATEENMLVQEHRKCEETYQILTASVRDKRDAESLIVLREQCKALKHELKTISRRRKGLTTARQWGVDSIRFLESNCNHLAQVLTVRASSLESVAYEIEKYTDSFSEQALISQTKITKRLLQDSAVEREAKLAASIAKTVFQNVSQELLQKQDLYQEQRRNKRMKSEKTLKQMRSKLLSLNLLRKDMKREFHVYSAALHVETALQTEVQQIVSQMRICKFTIDRLIASVNRAKTEEFSELLKRVWISTKMAHKNNSGVKIPFKNSTHVHDTKTSENKIRELKSYLVKTNATLASAKLNYSLLMSQEKTLRIRLGAVQKAKTDSAKALNASKGQIVKITSAYTLHATKLFESTLLTNEVDSRINSLRSYLCILNVTKANQESGWKKLHGELESGIQAKGGSERHSGVQIEMLRQIRRNIARVNVRKNKTESKTRLIFLAKEYAKARREIDVHRKKLDEAVKMLWQKKELIMKKQYLRDSINLTSARTGFHYNLSTFNMPLQNFSANVMSKIQSAVFSSLNNAPGTSGKTNVSESPKKLVQNVVEDDRNAREKVDVEIMKYIESALHASTLKKKLSNENYNSLSPQFFQPNVKNGEQNIGRPILRSYMHTPHSATFVPNKETTDINETPSRTSIVRVGKTFSDKFAEVMQKMNNDRSRRQALNPLRRASILVRQSWIKLYDAQQGAFSARKKFMFARLLNTKRSVQTEINALQSLKSLAGLAQLDPASVVHLTITISGVPETGFFDAKKRLELTIALNRHFLFPSIIRIIPGKTIRIQMRIDMYQVNPHLNNNEIAKNTHRLFKEGFRETIGHLKNEFNWPSTTSIKLTKIDAPRSNSMVYRNNSIILETAYEQQLQKRDIIRELDEDERWALLEHIRSNYFEARANISLHREEVLKNLKSDLKLENMSGPNVLAKNLFVRSGLALDQGSLTQEDKYNSEKLLGMATEKETRLKDKHKQALQQVADIETKIRISNAYEQTQDEAEKNSLLHTSKMLREQIKAYKVSLESMTKKQLTTLTDLKKALEQTAFEKRRNINISRELDFASPISQTKSLNEKIQTANVAVGYLKRRLAEGESQRNSTIRLHKQTVSALKSKLEKVESKASERTKKYERRLDEIVTGASSILGDALSSIPRSNYTSLQKYRSEKLIATAMDTKTKFFNAENSQKILQLRDNLNQSTTALLAARKGKVASERAHSKVLADMQRNHAREIKSMKSQNEKDIESLKVEFKKLKTDLKHSNVLFREKIDAEYKLKLSRYNHKKNASGIGPRKLLNRQQAGMGEVFLKYKNILQRAQTKIALADYTEHLCQKNGAEDLLRKKVTCERAVSLRKDAISSMKSAMALTRNAKT